MHEKKLKKREAVPRSIDASCQHSDTIQPTVILAIANDSQVTDDLSSPDGLDFLGKICMICMV